MPPRLRPYKHLVQGLRLIRKIGVDFCSCLTSFFVHGSGLLVSRSTRTERSGPRDACRIMSIRVGGACLLVKSRELTIEGSELIGSW